MLLEIDSISLSFDKKTILNKVSLSLKNKQLGCLLGPSGCGKTTLLRCIAGIESPSTGAIYCDGINIHNQSKESGQIKRVIGMVPQDLALFPHLTVMEHILFPISHTTSVNKKKVTNELLALTHLGGERDKYPHQLSGGQQKRVALARALAHNPKLLLLDEPFSNLDHELRNQLLKEVKTIAIEKKMSVLLVTHDRNEAFFFADYCGVLHEGVMLQWDTTYDLYHQPTTPKIATLLGEGCFLKIDSISHNKISLAGGSFILKVKIPIAEGAQYLFIRPDDIQYNPRGSYRFQIIKKEFHGAFIAYTLALPNAESILCYTRSHINLEVGKKLPITIDMEHCICFDAID